MGSILVVGGGFLGSELAVAVASRGEGEEGWRSEGGKEKGEMMEGRGRWWREEEVMEGRGKVMEGRGKVMEGRGR